MAFLFYKVSTDKERIRTLSYPFPPLVEDYFSLVDVKTDFTTYLNCYKYYTNQRKHFDFDKITVYMRSRSNLSVLANECNVQFTKNMLMQLLCEFDCDTIRAVEAILRFYYIANKDGWNYSFYERRLEEEESSTSESDSPDITPEPDVTDYSLHFIISKAINEADLIFLKLLLRYGYEAKISYSDYAFGLDTAKKLVLWLPFTRMPNLPLIYCNLTHYVESDRRLCRRRFDVLKVLDAVMRKRAGCDSLQRYVECLEVYFESIPEPFLTKSEMKEMILNLLSGQKIRNVYQYVEAIADEIIELFPEASSSDRLSPRSLQHLCRCKVRKVYTTTFTTLPHFVTFLVEGRYITRSMYDYILCETPPKMHDRSKMIGW